MARYLITGGDGFIGSAVVEKLVSRGDGVIIASRTEGETSSPDIERVYLDLNDRATIDRLEEHDFDGVIHLAWSSIPSIAEKQPSFDVQTNVAGTVSLLEVLSTRQPVPIVFASSGGTVYGHVPAQPIHENTKLQPISFYGLSKANVEAYCQLYRANRGLDVRIARISNPYGPTQSDGKGQGAATIFARKVLKREEITIWGDGSVVRDYVHVDDIAAGMLHLLDAARKEEAQCPTYNLGSGIGTSLRELIDLLALEIGISAQANYGEKRPFDLAYNVLDIRSMRDTFSWAPRDIHVGLSDLVSHLKSVD